MDDSRPTQGEIEQAINDLPEAFLLCRDIMHRWQKHTAQIGEMGTRERRFRCTRCHVIKLQILSATGHILDSRFEEYPPGYLLKGYGRLDQDARAAVRLVTTSLWMSGKEG